MSTTSDLNSSKIKQSSSAHVSAPSSGRTTANTSPTESIHNPPRSYSMSNVNNNPSNIRVGAGSPSYEASASGRFFSKRAREIQAEEGVGPTAPPGLSWIPPASGSTSLRDRENIIPESPPSASGTFPEQATLPVEYSSPAFRGRARAGTVPSRFSPGGLPNTPPAISGIPSTSRPSPAPSPFKSHSPQNVEMRDTTPVSIPASSSTMDSKSRLRSGSLNIPPRTNYVSAFGPSFFASTTGSGNWSQGRDRSATTAGIQPLPQIPSSPAHSTFSREDEGSHMAPKTLDYLGLVDTPQTSRATLARPAGLDTLIEGQRAAAMQPFISEMAGIQRNLNRIRSYSVNAKEKYAEDEDEEESRHLYSGQQSGAVTPAVVNAQSLAQAQASAAAHALAVAAYANNLSPSSRPRARTASVLDSPPVNRMKSYLATPSKLDSMTSASDLRGDYFDVANASDRLRIGSSATRPSSGEGGLASIEESSLEGPTRALWLGNIPPSTTTTSLLHIFQPFGNVESARVLTHKNCGFINYETVQSAVNARNVLNLKELFPGSGPTRIGFAKPSSTGSNGTPTPNGGAYGTPSPDPHARGGNAEGEGALSREGGASSGVNGKESGSGSAATAVEVPKLPDLKEDILKIMKEFGAEDGDIQKAAKSIDTAIEYNTFEAEIPTIPEPSHNRVHDAPKLREIRKKIDNGACSQPEIEQIAIDMLSEVAELSSDYLGNTVVQKLFEHCSEEIKENMLVEIGPHLAEIGIHKNGTWAGQKIIDVAKTAAQMSKITECLRPYTVALFLDQYGNYVLQCCLRFGAPWNDYVFETMLSRLFEIAQGRFGSRAMRACLESHHASKIQQRMLAAAIALHSVQLATNANGALLLTWFLDTCNFPLRRTVLAPLLVPHLVHLCTHKVAYLTVLKVINQKNEPEARDTILKALFFSPGDKVLEDILRDHACGATLIFKVLTTPFFEDSMRSEVSQNVRNVLQKLKATPSQGYKRLMDEVGLSTRNGINNSSSRDHSRDGTHGGSDRRPSQQTNSQVQSSVPRDNVQPSYYSSPAYDPATLAAQFPQAGGSFDPQTIRALEQLNLGAASMYGAAAPTMGNPTFPYQLLQQSMARPPGFFGLPMGGFNAQMPSDQFRGTQPGGQMPAAPTPMMGGMGNAFNPLVAQQLMNYPYAMNGMPGMFPQQPQQQPQPQHQGGGRRGGRR